MDNDLIPLSSPEAAVRARSGGKGANLARLIAAGFNVPDGFVIAAGAASGERVPEALRQRLVAACRALAPGGGAVAVRSSALDEDGAEASFAGQHATVLDVRVEGLIDAVETCLASLHSAAAAAYRARADATEPARMAVVVQRMVPARLAGVAFSVDPLTGDEDRIVVEAVRGVGEALVAGLAEADRVVLSRHALEVLEEHHPGAPVLDAASAREVALVALRAEAEFGSPQDIEWAMAGTELFVLQSRPITALANGGAAGGWLNEFDTPTSDADLWTSANVQEILPGLLTPLTITLFEQTVPRAYTMDYHDLHLLGRGEWPVFMGVFYNRVFLNIGATRLVGSRALGATADAIEERYLGGVVTERTPPGTRERLTNWRHKAESLPFLVRMTLGLRRQAEHAGRRVLTLDRKLRALDPATLPDDRIERIRRVLMDESVRMAKAHLRVTALAGAQYDVVARFVRPVLGGETEANLPTLFTGIQGVESAQISVDLWGLSRVALAERIDGALRDASFDPWQERKPAWQAAFAAFIERHGHRGLNEMEVSARTWRADPAQALAVVRSFLDMPEAQSPPASLRRQEAARLALTDEIAARMNPVQARAFRWVLHDAQRWVSLRERTKSLLVRCARLGDHLMPEVQARLAGRGIIDAPGDLFFLAHAEVSAALGGSHETRQADVVRRKREYERNRYVVLPGRFRGRPIPLDPAERAGDGGVLTGTPVSAGIVTGRARVILDPRTDAPLQPGEILVAPVTDAGWTPLFALAAGLVVDLGSALSHGSTVAREYGLPGVVNVHDATRTIRTGDIVAIDGTKGTVTIVERDS